MLALLKRTLSGNSDDTQESNKKPRLEKTDAVDSDAEKNEKPNRRRASISNRDKKNEKTDKSSSSEPLIDIIKRIDKRTERLEQQWKDTYEFNKELCKEFDELTMKVTTLENCNSKLEVENADLKEKLLNLEYEQHRNNLVFEGVWENTDNSKESDYDTYTKIRDIITKINGISPDVAIARCHHLGKRGNYTRPILCCFQWYGDVMKIMQNKKSLPKNVFVSEDYPQEWNDRRKVLRPIFNMLQRTDEYKEKISWKKDKLVVDGKEYSAAPISNIHELNGHINIADSCERKTGTSIVFQGIHSIFSNFHPVNFKVNGIDYISMEQYIQAKHAELCDDDTTHRKIMLSNNPYRVKKLSYQIKKGDDKKWKSEMKDIVYQGLKQKFLQNTALKELLLSTGSVKIAEASTDTYWGVGVKLRDNRILDEANWKGDGLMCELYSKLRAELK